MVQFRLALLLALILCLPVFLSAKAYIADTQGPIYIRADGSIDPPTAPISTSNNITYTLTGGITSQADGIVVERGNIILDGAGFTVHGSLPENFVLESNGLYLKGVSNIIIRNMTVVSFHYGILLDSSSNNSISGNNITDNLDHGIELNCSSNNSINTNNLTNNGIGIYLNYSSKNTVSGNIATNNYHGIFIDSSSNNTICRNSIAAYDVTGYSGEGIGIVSSSSNIISGNNIIANSVGIYLVYVSNNTFSGNKVTDGTYGIWLYSSSSNIIFHNNFANNNIQSSTGGSVNIWDNGVEGNFWSDYTGTDSNQDGIGDTPYIIDGNNTDHYPLMGTFQSFNVSVLGTQDFEEIFVVSNSSIEKAEFRLVIEDPHYPWGIILWVSGRNGTTGFCRVTFQNHLLNSSAYPVYVGTTIPTTSKIVESNGTHTTIYFAYNELPLSFGIDIVPEFSFLLILPLFMIATLIAVLVYRRKHSELMRV